MNDSGRLLIVADDFTGACDAAAPFAGTRRTLVVVGAPAAWPDQVEVLSVDLDLRERSSLEAHALIVRTAHLMAATRVFLKIDSTLRGPIAGLVSGALVASGSNLAVISPAFPEQRRLLVGGRLIVDGQAGTSLTQILGLDARHVVVDADGVESLRRVARAWRMHPDWLLVGSAGLARQVAGWAAPKLPAPTAGVVLVIAGSPAPATQAQIERLRGLGPVMVIAPNAPVPLRPSEDQRVVVLCTPPPASERDTGERAAAVADVVGVWAGEFRPGGVILAGGATARLVCERLNARGVRLHGELQPGIALGAIRGGVWDSLPVVTKAGGFGTAETLLDVLHALGVSSVAQRTHD